MPRTARSATKRVAIVDGRQIRAGLGKLRRMVGRAEDLLAENKMLRTQVRRLERELRAVQTGLAALDGNRGSRRTRATATTAKRTRRPITDPAVLERRRQALEKARKVRAEKRAAAAKG